MGRLKKILQNLVDHPAADEWCEGIWFEKDGPPPWISFEEEE